MQAATFSCFACSNFTTKFKISMSVQTKIALVTGGSRGLGKDMATSIAKKGIDVILTWRNNEEQAYETVAAIEQLGQKAKCLFLDMSDFKSLDEFLENVSTVLISFVATIVGISPPQQLYTVEWLNTVYLLRLLISITQIRIVYVCHDQ